MSIIRVAGTGFENRDRFIKDLVACSMVTFNREPKNSFDALAIAIQDDKGNKIGYVPREQNQEMAHHMDSGSRFTGRIYRTMEFKPGKWRVEISCLGPLDPAEKKSE